MVKANNTLSESFPQLRKSDQDLFRIAYPIAISKNYRLVEAVNSFMGTGLHILTSLFSEFTTYPLANYRNRPHPENTGHLAFICEDRYKNSSRLFGLAITAEDDTGGFVLVAKVLPIPLAAGANPLVWTKKDWDYFQKLKKAAQPATPVPPENGKICFNCG